MFLNKPKWFTTAFVFSVLMIFVVTTLQGSSLARKEQGQYEVGSTVLFIAENKVFRESEILEIDKFSKDEAREAFEGVRKRASTQNVKLDVSPAIQPSVKEMICEAFGKNCAKAIRVAKCESGLRTKAHNKTDPYGGSYGLFQINGVHLTDRGVASKYSPKDLFKPAINIKIALKLSNGGKSWGPWSCRSA